MEQTKAEQQAFASLGYLFLRMVFAKEQYPQSVVEELQWVTDELMQENPDAGLLKAIREEFREGDYLKAQGAFPYTTLQETLLTNYGYDFYETQRIVDRLHEMSFPDMPLIVLIGKSGTGKTSAALNLESQYHLKQTESYTTRPQRMENEKGHSFITEEEFDKIPKEEIMAYFEYRGYRYCATREQLNESDLYIVHPEGYETLKERYHDRPMLSIELTTSDEIREARMRNRGSSEEEIKDRLKQDEVVFQTIQADAAIDTSNSTVEVVGCKIFSLLRKATEALNTHNGVMA